MNKINAVHAATPTARTHEVAPRRTPTTPANVRSAIAAAYRRQTGAEPTSSLLDVLTAHVSHETARGERMYNFNFGGIKGAGPDGATTRYATREIGADDEERRIVDGFRAYRTLGDGAADYLATMRVRYPNAVAAAARGDVDGFSTALKQRGYFTAHLDDYAASMRALTRESGRATPSTTTSAAILPPDLPLAFAPAMVPPPDPSAYPTQAVVGRVLDAIASAGARIGAPIAEAEQDQPLFPKGLA